MVVLDDDSPLGARLFAQPLTYRSVRSDDALCAVAPEDVGASVGRVGKHTQHTRMGQPTPAQLAGPHATVGSAWKAALFEGGNHRVRRARRLKRGEDTSNSSDHLLVGIDDGLAVDIAHVAD